MSRLLGIISTRATSFDTWLLAVPERLPSLAAARPDGWGAAAYSTAGDWQLETRPAHAGGSDLASTTPSLHGTALVAHVHDRTGGELPNRAGRQPIRRRSWVFAHDGTIDDPDYLRAGVSVRRLAEWEGDTNGELLFAYLLSRLDSAGLEGATKDDLDSILGAVIADLVARRVGELNFLLSDGAVLYAHRYGRPMCLLERREHGALLALASDPLTDDAWLSLDDWTLLRCERGERLDVVFLRGTDPRPRSSEIELPFTD